MWFNLMVFTRGLGTHQNAILVMFFFSLFFFHLWNVAFVVTLLRFYPWPCATSLRDWNRNKSRAFSWNVLIYLANLLSLWTKFTQYFPLSGAVKKNASQAFKFDGFMCHGYIFSPLLKLLSCLARGRTDINVGVIQITQTDSYHGYGFWIDFSAHKSKWHWSLLKLLENTVQNKKKVAFNGDHAIYCQNFTAGTTECENYLVKNNPATVLSGPLLSPIWITTHRD